MDVAQQLAEIGEQVDRAASAVGNDGGASPVLLAVVQEFQKKSAKAQGVAKGADAGVVREAVVEMEQAADSAKAAAEADAGATPQTRDAVADAHLAICMLKAKTPPR